MFEVLDENCIPERKTKLSAYVDMKASKDLEIAPGETKVILLGVKIDLELLGENVEKLLSLYCNPKQEHIEDFFKDHYLEIAIRSSLSAKYGLIIANGSGKVDLDYPDEIGIIIHNPIRIVDKHTPAASFIIKKGDRVAQSTLARHEGKFMGYDSKEIRTGGFGSTGK